MKKIMFNDKLHLTAAVISGTKTTTARLVSSDMLIDGFRDEDISSIIREGKSYRYTTNTDDVSFLLPKKYNPKYEVGEIVAVAQRYSDLDGKIIIQGHPERRHEYLRTWVPASHPGWNNKSYVKPIYMKHFIKIYNVKAWRLQDIADDMYACIDEGIIKRQKGDITEFFLPNELDIPFHKAGFAFRELIIKTMGLKVWNANPWIWRYTFSTVVYNDVHSIHITEL